MRIGIKSYQFVKEDKSYAFFKDRDRYFIKTKCAGIIETTKEYYECYMGKED